MATSGSTDYNLTGNDIVNRALKHMGVLAAGESATAEDAADGLESLNVMVKQWQAEGINLWKQEELILWLVKGTTKYTIGPSGDNASISWVRTTLSAAGSASDGTITVTSITGISSADKVGIVLDDGTLQWDTVNGAPAGSTVTLTGTLNSAAASGNQVWAYTSKPSRPLRLDTPRRRDSALQDVPIFEVSRQEYFDTPNKTSQGKPVNVHYDPQLTNGEVHVWPAPESVDDTIIFTAKMPIEDFDSGTNNPDFPQEWLAGLAWCLADEMALQYEIPADRHQRIMRNADRAKAILGLWDSEETSVLMQPDT